ncbi:MAG: glycoside hydrolase family 140 protein [Terrimicrobiaceae bacterium]
MPELPRLSVAPDGRRLITGAGRPFFYLGDTAWELIHRLTLKETREYLECRAAQGFNVVQCVALAELDGLRIPTPGGHVPFRNGDPGFPEELYWRHVDEVVRMANEMGIYMGLLPTWGDKWNQGSGVGPEIFHPGNAEAYGRWLGSRYREAGVIWILGGDRAVESPSHRKVLDAMAAGLREGDGGRGLITFHPRGGTTARAELPGCSWLDFDMFQSGHCILALENWYFAEMCLASEPPRPFLDGEPCYEDHEVMLPEWRPVKPGWRFGAHAVRRAAYWSAFSGACGHVYGAQPCWMMWDERYEPFCGVRKTWREALHLPGATQLRHLRDLALAAELLWMPENGRITGSLDTWEARAVAARAPDKLLVYTPERQDLVLDLSGLRQGAWQLFWEDPSNPGPRETGLRGSTLPEWLTIPAVSACPTDRDALYVLEYGK